MLCAGFVEDLSMSGIAVHYSRYAGFEIRIVIRLSSRFSLFLAALENLKTVIFTDLSEESL
jgi:hypothetical protein